MIPGLSDGELQQRLLKQYPRALEEDLNAAIRFAEGSYGKAEQFLQKKAAADRETARGWLEAAFATDRYSRVSAFAAAKQKRENLLPLLDLFLRMMTDVLLAKTGGEAVLLRQEDAEAFSDRATRKQLVAMCDAIIRCRESVEANGNLSADLTRLAADL